AALAELRPETHVPLSARQQVVDDAIRGPNGYPTVAPGAAERILHELDAWGHHLTLLRLDPRRHELLELAVLSDALLVVPPSRLGGGLPAADISGVSLRGRRGRELQLRIGGEPSRIRLTDTAAAQHAWRAIEAARARADQRGDTAADDSDAQTVT